MSSFRRLAPAFALTLLASHLLIAQSSNSTPAGATQTQAQPASSQGSLSVQARLKARREQRRVQEIQDTYGRLYEVFVGSGYQRFTPGALQHTNEYSWDLGLTRNVSKRLGVTVEGRGNYGAAFVEPKPDNQNIVHPSIHQYSVLAGPSYRFYLKPKFSVSGRVMAGYAYGNFSGDANGNQTLSTYLGLYPDGSSFAASAAVVGEYNITPRLAFRIAPEIYPTGFGSKFQSNFGGTYGLVMRFGKQ
jgi:hypothetical protein